MSACGLAQFPRARERPRPAAPSRPVPWPPAAAQRGAGDRAPVIPKGSEGNCEHAAAARRRRHVTRRAAGADQGVAWRGAHSSSIVSNSGAAAPRRGPTAAEPLRRYDAGSPPSSPRVTRPFSKLADQVEAPAAHNWIAKPLTATVSASTPHGRKSTARRWVSRCRPPLLEPDLASRGLILAHAAERRRGAQRLLSLHRRRRGLRVAAVARQFRALVDAGRRVRGARA